MDKDTCTIETLRNRIKLAYATRHNWRAVAAQYGVSSGMAYRIAVNDYEPREAHIRHKLGLPALAPAPVCAKCGEVHVTKRCTSSGDKPRRPRIAINLANVVSAAETIRKHGGAEYALQLAKMLEEET